MVFIETDQFTKYLPGYLNDDQYAQLQAYLHVYPQAGLIIPGTGGVRKLRWAAGGKGKRGGVRIIYYWIVKDVQLLMLTLYKKGEVDDLTSDEKKALKRYVKDIVYG